MKTIHLNIGANVNGIERFTLSDVELACVRVGFYPYESRIAQSETEKTFALECSDNHKLVNQTKQTVKRLAAILQQDCIACIIAGNGYLVGDKAKEWGGKFLPLHWISVK